MAHRGVSGAYGDLAERRARMDAKYDPALEASLADWISKSIGDKVTGPFNETLKNGVVLCKLMNKLVPGSISNIYTGEMAFKQMENIGKFLGQCPPYGVRSDELFQAPDLYEGANMTAVLVCLDSLRRVSGVHEKGGKVEPQTVASSVLLRTGKVGSLESMAKREPVAKPDGTAYDHAGKSVVNAKAGADGNFGDLAERMEKINSKYDKTLEAAVRKWIEDTTGEKLNGEFQAALKSGVVLCQLVNKLKPGIVKSVSPSSLPFKQMENINNFLTAAQTFGIRSEDLFQTVYLYEGTNMTQVLLTLDNLMRVSRK